MPNHRIIVTFDGTSFDYNDEITGQHGSATSVRTGHTIVWKLQDTTADKRVAGLRILFNKNGSPCNQSEFDAPAGNDTTPMGHLDHPTKIKYSYTAIAVLKHGPPVQDDPQIIFEDADQFPDLLIVRSSLDMLGGAIQEAFQGLLAHLNDSAGLKRDPNALFFPGGINNISVQVTVAGVPVNVAISGPEATPLFPAPNAEK